VGAEQAMDINLTSGQLRAVFDTSPDGVFVFEPEALNVLEANEAACRLCGYTHEEMLRLSLMDLTAQPEETLQALHAKDMSIPLRYMRRKDGSVCPVEIVASQFRVDGVTMRVSHVRDISNRLRRERELAESEGKYAVAFKTSPDSVNINRLSDGLFLEVNDGFTSLTGYTAADVEGKTSLEIDLWADARDRERLVAELAQGGAATNVEAVFRTKDGTERTGLMSARLIEIGGEPCILSVTRDITERRAIEAAIAASEEKYSVAFRTSPDSVNITSMETGRYVDVNDGFCAMTGYTPDEVIGRTSVELGIWDDPADRARLVAALASDGRMENLEAVFHRKDGSTLVGLMSARPMAVGGEQCLLSLTRDISDRIEAERQLRLSERRLQLMVKDVAHAMGRVVESRDPYTHGHQQRVALVSGLIGRQMGLVDDELDMLELAALVHDVGKLAIPAEILNKPGRLSTLEMGLIRVHSERGFEILKDIDFGWPIAELVLQHHERMDGSGYPRGLAGADILPAARVLCVADVVEAMASHRPYRASLGLDCAVAEIEAGAALYDPDVVLAVAHLHATGALDFLVS